MLVSDVAIDRPVFTTMAALAVLVMGALALFRLGVDLFPDVSFPVVAITTVYRGAAPEEVEQQITRPIEEAVSTINGVDVVQSFSRDSVSVVIVLFKLDVDLLRATTDTREKVQAVKVELPKDADDPLVAKFDPSATPIMIYTVLSDQGATETRRLVDNVIRPTLETVPGVGSITITGGTVREIQVDLDQTKLQSLGLSAVAVAQALRAEGFDLPGGRITQGGRELTVKAQGRFKNIEEIRRTVLFSLPDGTQIRVADVGDVVDGVKEVRELARVDGKEAVTFSVQKVSGGNTVAVSAAVTAAIDKLAPTLKGVQVNLIADQARYINNNIHRLRSHLILGGLLAVLVIFFFMLDLRSTLISAVALPGSVIATFFVMWQLGFTLNIMSMLALTLSIGLLIDDSVVVRENIFRHLEAGADPIAAARQGTSEIALAVFATTMTIVAVFVPIAFMGGLIGKFFKEFGLTVAAAVLVSLVVSFTIDPMLSARLAQKVDHDRHAKMRTHWFYGPPTRFFETLDSTYRAILGWALSRRKTVVALAVAVFVLSLVLPAFMGKEFFTRGDQGKFEAVFELQPGTSLLETDRMARQAEALLGGIRECPTLFTLVGRNREASAFSIQALCTPKAERERHIDLVMEEARQRLRSLPGASIKIRVPDLADNGQPAPITLTITGPDFVALQHIADQALEIVRSTSGTVDVGTSARPGSPEQRFVIDRVRASDHGVSFSAAAMTLRTALEGDVVSTVPDRGDDIDVRVRLRTEDRATVADLTKILVPARNATLVRLDEVVHLEEASTPASIERKNRQRAVTVTANLKGRSLGEVLGDITPRLEEIMTPGYSYKFEGDAENMKDTFQNMLIAIALAVLFIYFVLASQFESFVHPFTIMVALPLTIVGALLALFLTGLPIGMPAMIGIVLLLGLVTKNGILLVDFTNQLRSKGLDVIPALLEAGPTRLRPILMTSSAIVLGELPTALSTAEGSEFNVPMAVAVIGGVITSTLLTLVVVPVAYVWIDRLALKKDHTMSTPAE
jgi:hydrophobe/amphiphile efflux-1 (HAE1) family protein